MSATINENNVCVMMAIINHFCRCCYYYVYYRKTHGCSDVTSGRTPSFLNDTMMPAKMVTGWHRSSGA